MKATRFFGAALFAVALCAGMVSCDNEDDPGIVLDPTIQPTVVDDVLAQPTVDIDADATRPVPTVVELEASAPVTKLVIGPREVIAYLAESTPARGTTEASNVFHGTYTIGLSGFTFTVPGIGEITVPMDMIGSVLIGGLPYSIDAALATVPGTPGEVSLCRTWTNPTYRAGIYFDKLPIYGVSDTEKNGSRSIAELARTVLSRIIAEDSKFVNEGFKLLSSDIESLTFTSNKVYLVFENGRVEESSWKWVDQAKGKLSTVIDGKDVVIETRFEKGTPNKGHFVIDANCEGIGGLGAHTISGRLVCSMND